MNPVDVLDLVSKRIPLAKRLGIQALDMSPTSTRVLLPFDAEPVSYTHLDVYKRQHQSSALATWLVFARPRSL